VGTAKLFYLRTRVEVSNDLVPWLELREWWCLGFPITSPIAGTDRLVFSCLTMTGADTLRSWLRSQPRHGLKLWAWCLMTNHVHLIVVPQREDSMALALGRAHMQYARRVNRENGCCGHLWANRYHSSPLDMDHLCVPINFLPVYFDIVSAVHAFRSHGSVGAHEIGQHFIIFFPRRNSG